MCVRCAFLSISPPFQTKRYIFFIFHNTSYIFFMFYDEFLCNICFQFEITQINPEIVIFLLSKYTCMRINAMHFIYLIYFVTFSITIKINRNTEEVRQWRWCISTSRFPFRAFRWPSYLGHDLSNSSDNSYSTLYESKLIFWSIACFAFLLWYLSMIYSFWSRHCRKKTRSCCLSADNFTESK